MDDIRILLDCGDDQSEYWTHVSPQEELPLADSAWKERTLNQLDEFVLTHFGEAADDESQIHDKIAAVLLVNPATMAEFRLLLALSDKRLYLDLSYVFSRILDPTDDSKTLCGCNPSGLTRHPTSFFENLLAGRRGMRRAREGVRRDLAANTIAEYLIRRGLIQVLRLYSDLEAQARESILARWLLPKETQQNEAKRRGHGAEAAVARILKLVGCSILPPDKDTNPMGAYDPNISLETLEVTARRAGMTFSSDLVLLDDSEVARVCVMGLVQSSDPGQFGVNKSDEVVTLRRLFDRRNEAAGESQVELWGLVDGVGYSENKEGTVNKMLRSFHYFVQMKSAYKVALRAHRLGLIQLDGISFDASFYSVRTRDQMIEKYVPSGVRIIDWEAIYDSQRTVAAGAARLYLP